MISRINLMNKRGQIIAATDFPVEEISQTETVEILTRRKDRIVVHVFQIPEDGCQVTVHRAHATTLQLHAPMHDGGFTPRTQETQIGPAGFDGLSGGYADIDPGLRLICPEPDCSGRLRLLTNPDGLTVECSRCGMEYGDMADLSRRQSEKWAEKEE